jgi:hypothetical protein
MLDFRLIKGARTLAFFIWFLLALQHSFTFPDPCVLLPVLDRVSEAFNPFNDLLAFLGLSIVPGEFQGQQNDKNNNNQLACKCRPDSRSILRGVFSSEYQGASNATDSTHTDEGRRAEGALPMTTDVVGLNATLAASISSKEPGLPDMSLRLGCWSWLPWQSGILQSTSLPAYSQSP